MHTYRLALIGFGGVNRALAQLIANDPLRLAGVGVHLQIVAITDLQMGTLISDDGIDLLGALGLPRGATFAEFEGGRSDADNEAAIKSSCVDIVIEATFTNPVDGEPALSHVRWALESGKNVATTNKGPVALHGRELNELAAQRGVRFAYEGSVLSGTPTLGLARDQFAGLTVTGFDGILNGTSNFVLERMENGRDLADAVREAQELGYAEADPTADIEGSDVRLKVAILANEILGADLRPEDVPTYGISGISAVDIIAAAREGKRFKLVGSAHRDDFGHVTARVAPLLVSPDHPLASISGATNAVAFDTDLLGTVTISGPGAGRVETAFALLADIVSIHQHSKERTSG